MPYNLNQTAKPICTTPILSLNEEISGKTSSRERRQSSKNGRSISVEPLSGPKPIKFTSSHNARSVSVEPISQVKSIKFNDTITICDDLSVSMVSYRDNKSDVVVKSALKRKTAPESDNKSFQL